MQKEKTESEFIDAEDQTFFGQQAQQFNHQVLVMEAMRKCMESATHELMEGWYNEKFDSKTGTLTKTYIESTRERFFSCVENCEMIMCCDYDSLIKKRLKIIKDLIKKKKQELCEEQWKWYCNLTPSGKRTTPILRDELNMDQIFYMYFVNYKEKMYKLIFKELSKLTKRLHFYEGKSIKQ